jgi:O-methyltransferase involved in polyketide biosynthesis
VAAERALLTELGVLDDPYARSMLGPAMGAVYRIALRWPHRVPTLLVTLDALVAAGLDPARPALFVLEGVTMYLPEDVVRGQLTGLHERSGPGSRLTTDVFPPADAATTADRRQLRMQRLARAGSGETLHQRVDRDDAVALVEGCGWSVDEAVGARTAASGLVPPGSGLPVDAIDDRKTLLAAVRP